MPTRESIPSGLTRAPQPPSLKCSHKIRDIVKLGVPLFALRVMLRDPLVRISFPVIVYGFDF